MSCHPKRLSDEGATRNGTQMTPTSALNFAKPGSEKTPVGRE